MGVVAICDVLLVDLVGADASSPESTTEQLDELLLESGAEIINDPLCTTRGSQCVHLAKVRLGI